MNFVLNMGVFGNLLYHLNSSAVPDKKKKSVMELKPELNVRYDDKDLQYLWRVEQPEPSTLVWEHIFHKIICVSYSHTYKVHPEGIA